MEKMETMEKEIKRPFTGIVVQISQDLMSAHIKLYKSEEEEEDLTENQVREALRDKKVIYGIKEHLLERLAAKPVYELNLEIAKGTEPIKGKDGEVIVNIKKDKDYKPEYNEEGTVDYKSINYFQLAKKGQILGTIIPAENGIDGKNIFADKIIGGNGKNPNLPMGLNTYLSEDKSQIIALCDGLIKYSGDRIDISEMLHIRGNVDMLSGNINFAGDVTVDGDVCSGFYIKAGGNIIVKGVVEEADLQADGSIHIMKGINGIGKEKISSIGDLTCKYIENAVVEAGGSIYTDYIIDSNIVCHENIELTGSQEVLFGGEIRVLGNLKAKEIGNHGERSTKVEIMGIQNLDRKKMNSLNTEKDQYKKTINMLVENVGNIAKMIEKGHISPEIINQLEQLREQVHLLEGKIVWIEDEIEKLENSGTLIYNGSITCKRTIYPGVKIYFGDIRFKSEEHTMYNCMIYNQNGEALHVNI